FARGPTPNPIPPGFKLMVVRKIVHIKPRHLNLRTPSRRQGRQTMNIVFIGGPGLIGSKTAAILRQRSHEVVAASPNTGVNTITGEGLKQAMAGTQVVIDLANSPSFEDKAV